MSSLLPALTVALALLPTQAQAGSYPQELVEARRELRTGNVETAIRVARQYTRDHPRDPRGFVVLGDAYAERSTTGRFDAIDAYRRAQRLAPSDPEPPYRIAQIGIRLGGDDGEWYAQDGLGDVLALDPDYRSAWEQWLLLYRNGDHRAQMVERLRPFATRPSVAAKIGLLLVELERYAEADALLDSALIDEPSNVASLAIRAQSAFEQGDSLAGEAYYRSALANAEHDSTDVLWRQAIGIATPEEVRAWTAGVAPADKSRWLEAFWARRNPDLFTGINRRVAEHFRRWRVARAKYPLLHPSSLYHRSVVGRGLFLEPSTEERAAYLACEATDEAGVSSVEDRARSFGGAAFVPLGLDLRKVDSVAARVGYNLVTGLDDRGVMYLRFGPPQRQLIGADNVRNPRCGGILLDLERWWYNDLGQVRFSRPSGFWSARGGGAVITEMVFRPMNERQFAVTEIGLTQDAPSEPAPLEFGVWTAQFRNSQDPARTDLAVITTRSAVAAMLTSPSIGEGRPARSERGVATLTAGTGSYTLVAHARDDGKLGRQALGVAVRSFELGQRLSDLLLATAWARPLGAAGRDTMLSRVARELRFRGDDTVRTYAEVYGLAAESGASRYRATYLLLKTGNPEKDAARDEWPNAVRFEFERRRSAAGMHVETLDIEPRWIEEGTYLLRLLVEDLVAGSSVAPTTIMFRVDD